MVQESYSNLDLLIGTYSNRNIAKYGRINIPGDLEKILMKRQGKEDNREIDLYLSLAEENGISYILLTDSYSLVKKNTQSFYKVSLDEKGRFQFNKDIRGLLEPYGFNGEIEIVFEGRGDHIRIYKKDDYNTIKAISAGLVLPGKYNLRKSNNSFSQTLN